ncbi:MAG: DNA ligase D [Rubrivivax sp.]|nr:MAG: DNA ligase D [Rubrivivax sp.]
MSRETIHAGTWRARELRTPIAQQHYLRKQAPSMNDPLAHYRLKRDFKITSEPQGQTGKRGHGLSFVIQKHAARRLHYDFRLELDGTLKSWAVPKGPSLDPKDKRMAVHVEDHPLDYANFEGVIPPKQYGAGTVIVWDRGEWIPLGDPQAGYRAGKLKFELKGVKLSGHWTLVRMHGRDGERQEPWLLIKENDEAARPAAEYDIVSALPDSVLAKAPNSTRAKASTKAKAPPGRARKADNALPAGAVPADLPLNLSPQLAVLVDTIPPGDDWVYELKYDGYRLLARIDGDDVRLFTREGNDWTSRMKGLAQAVKDLALPSGWLDGEIIVQGEDGAPDFQLLQNAFDTAHTQNIQYVVFDLPYFGGHDLRQVPLVERRALLQKIMAAATPTSRVKFSESFSVPPQGLLHKACEMHLEGLIGKRANAPYTSSRSPSWVKLKCTRRQEFVIGGYTDPKGSRVGLGALLLGVHDEHGALHYVGNVGTGFGRDTLTSLLGKLEALSADKPPFVDIAKGERGNWVKPKLVAEISFAGWTREGKLRQGVFHGLRTDKPATVITREKPMPTSQLKPTPSTAAAQPKLRVTHPDRIIDPSTGITKLELVQYYDKVAEHMLPHLKQRPVSLVRGPEGIGGELFFQKHGDKLKIQGIKQLDPALDPGHPSLLEVSTRQALLSSVQMNVIEFHTWNATTRTIEKPDRVVFDLDPGEGVAWPRLQEAAELVRVLLEELGLKSLLKTSGGKGLHVVVPITPSLGWDEVKNFSQAVVQHLARVLGDRFVSKSGPKNRVGKIFVDYLRNGRGATTAAAWSVRARPGMGVSVPLAWHELSTITSGAHWTLRTVDERLSLPNPWADQGPMKQSLKQAIKALEPEHAL